MRDFNSGDNNNFNGQFNFYNQPDPYKPLFQCTNEELLQERVHRNALLKKKFKKKFKFFLTTFSIGIVFFLLIAVWYQINGAFNQAMFVVGGIAVVIPVGLAWGTLFNEAEDEKANKMALREIKVLLQTRGVED